MHKIQVREAGGETPLARLSNGLARSVEARRTRLYGRFLDGFLLKNMVTSECVGRSALIDGRLVTNFGSSSYLGLERHPAVLEAGHRALDEWGNHAGCSRLLSSHENIIHLEEELAALVGAEKALVCANTSETHQGTIPALFGSADSAVFIDRSASSGMQQASLITKACGAALRTVDATSLLNLDNALRCSRSPKKVLLINGVCPLRGTVAKLREIKEICDHRGAVLYVDDSHGVGVFGEEGGGLAEELGLSFDNMILVGSLQDALGGSGGFVAALGSVIDFLRVTSRTYLFSGTLQPHAVEGARAAVRIVRSNEGHEFRQNLRLMSSSVRGQLQEFGFQVPAGNSPILPVSVGGEFRTLMAGRKLFDEGAFVPTLLSPVVPRGQACLRIALSTAHSNEDIQVLLQAFRGLAAYWREARHPLGQNLRFAREILQTQVRARLKNLSVVRF